MFGLPMEIVGPVVGIGAIIAFVVGGIAVLRLLPSGSRRRLLASEERQMLEELQARLAELDELKQSMGELEERVDFSERVLSNRGEGQRLGPPKA